MALQRYNLPFFGQEHLKHFLENYRFCQKSGNDACSIDIIIKIYPDVIQKLEILLVILKGLFRALSNI